MWLTSLLAAAAILAIATSEVRDSGLVVEYLGKPDDTCDEVARRGKIVSVHYTGRLDNGVQFDSSRERGHPLSFQLGAGQIIEGWEEGILGMCVGERRRLIVPPGLVNDDAESTWAGKVPDGSTLTFDTELVAVQEGAPVVVNVFKEIDRDNDDRLSKDEFRAYLRTKADIPREPDDSQEEVKKVLDQQAQVVDDIFAYDDKDGDGLISHKEFKGPKRDEL